ncbi:hypothetical protein SI65_10014 [Aspergillus cristatus]|uniref:MFS-type transporter criB n=1 Tax=Aspergillus cristatus TaxID=573508 RepID=CRIB_ASPCR|nr:RecName: Full=MFS-type transporter criB; AltName: Full=Echinulin biosynthesis cluster protein B [Aspergillus cristatus]ODM14528.1 hypothetical protein SI65_10014 [Aspergillus cristatus]
MGLSLVLSCGVIAGISGFLFGYDSGIMTTTIAQEQFLQQFKPKESMVGTIVAIMQAGGFFGCLTAGKLSDLWGRRKAIMFGCVFVVVGGALQAAAYHTAMLLIGRLVTGFGVGSLTMTVPVYQAEISPPRWRGTIVGCQQLMLAIGSAIANWTGYGCSFVNSSFQWRMPLALQAVPGIVLFFGSYFLPESPRWLVEHDALDAALHVVQRLYPDKQNLDSAYAEFQEIVEQIKQEKAQASERSYLQIFRRKAWRKRLFLGAGIWLMLNLTGINVINYYLTQFFTSLGYKGRRAIFLSGVYGSVGAATTFLALFFVHRLSRKTPLMMANISQTATLIVMAGLTAASELGKSGQMGGVAMIFLFFVIYCSTWGPLSWVYASEIFPTQIRSKGYSMASAVNCEWRFYFLFVATNFISALVLLFLYPETSGKSLEAIDLLFDDHQTIHRSTLEENEVRRTSESVNAKH